jgi:error-prone DNA polymerase
LKLSRRAAAWETLRLRDEAAPVVEESGAALRSARGVKTPYLPLMSAGQEVMTDYATVGLSLKKHPVAFVRESLKAKKIITARELTDENRCPHGKWVKIAGLVLVRQRPGTASGVVFVTLEDETGVANLILWSNVYERFRPAARHATLLQADGYVQREGQVIHVLAKRLFDLSDLIRGLNQPSRDFH